MRLLDRLTPVHGVPGFIRMDNGSEMTANAIRDWARSRGALTFYIEPGSPWENPFVESFGSRVRDEVLAAEMFTSLLEARIVIEDLRRRTLFTSWCQAVNRVPLLASFRIQFTPGDAPMGCQGGGWSFRGCGRRVG